jgi:hypothetical protein
LQDRLVTPRASTTPLAVGIVPLLFIVDNKFNAAEIRPQMVELYPVAILSVLASMIASEGV